MNFYNFFPFFVCCLGFGQDACEANLHSCDDNAALLQPVRREVGQSRTWALARDWRTDRDLANVTDIPPMLVAGVPVTLNFSSAVPVFGPNESYIALIHPFENVGPLAYLYSTGALSLFCTGPDQSHRTAVRVIGNETDAAYKRSLVFICDWPKEEYDLERFEVSLDDNEGNHLGTVVAEQKKLLQQYRTVACVRDVYPNAISGLRMLPQWLEFHHQHGVEHFIMYTVNLDSETLVDLWEPYIKSGLVTRVHFDKDFETNSGHNHTELVGPMMQDCLYRVKHHATWLLPHVDIDEFFNMKDGSLFEGGQVPDNYLGTSWDAIVKGKGLEINEVHSIQFPLYRFAVAEPGQIELSSVLREPDVQPTNPKYVVNTKVAKTIFSHWVTSWENGAQGLALSPDIGIAHHYREPHDYALAENIQANTSDNSMLQYVPRLSSALTERFHEETSQLLNRLSAEKGVESVKFSSMNAEQRHEELLAYQDPKISAWLHSLNDRRGIQFVEPPSESG
eukprot:Skav214420  [mRNA]  locus=scaffold586:227095:228615:+ [translate_table: standard]